MKILIGSLLLGCELQFSWLTKIIEIQNIEIYFSMIFIFLSLNNKHLQGTTYRKHNTLVNYKIACITKLCTIFILYSSLIKVFTYFNININNILNFLLCIYLPYYLEFAEYTGNRKIIMPSLFHNLMYISYRLLGKYTLINDSIKLEANYKKDKPYIIGIHPHGLFPFGSVGTLALPNDIKNIENIAPILNSKNLKTGIASICFYIPIIRDIFLWLGAVDCSKPVLKKLLLDGNSIAVFTGGGQEAQYSGLGSNKLILKNRDGFFKLALETRSNMIPVYTFGNNNIFNSFSWDLFGVLNYLKKIAGLWIPRGYFVPMRHNFVSIIGKPINVDKLSLDDNIDKNINKIKQQYMEELSKLFDKYKYLDIYCANKTIEYI